MGATCYEWGSSGYCLAIRIMHTEHIGNKARFVYRVFDECGKVEIRRKKKKQKRKTSLLLHGSGGWGGAPSGER